MPWQFSLRPITIIRIDVTNHSDIGGQRGSTSLQFVQSLFNALGWLGLAASVLLLCAATVCYIGRWDVVAAATFLPFWTWGLAGLGLALIGWFFKRAHRSFLLLCLIWVTAVAFLSDDLSRLLVSLFHAPLLSCKNGGVAHLRVVTLNCAGQSAAAAEVASEKSDSASGIRPAGEHITPTVSCAGNNWLRCSLNPVGAILKHSVSWEVTSTFQAEMVSFECFNRQ
jgi:hypothetical protein